MPEELFPLPGSSYRELAKIIQAYGVLSSEAVPAQVGQLASMHETIVSRNNKFLVATGIVQGGRSKKITGIGQELALALTHNIPEEISIKWRQIVFGIDFFQKLLAAVRIRKGMDESTLTAHVAYSAGQPRSATVMAGAGAVVDILKLSGLLQPQDGTLVAAEDSSVSAPTASTTPIEEPAPVQRALRVSRQILGTTISVNVQISVSCTPEQLPTLGRDLKSMLRELNRADNEPAGEQTEVQGDGQTPAR